MDQDLNYIEKNNQAWNAKTDFHVRSDFYDLESFLKGSTSLNEIELKLLGDVSGKTILHLQCHFGQDSISLARLGASVTGVDLSDKAINKATELAQQTKADAMFICCNIYDLPLHSDKQFDIVFTSYGTIGWLPDLDKWGSIVAKYLKPGGKFVIAEFHPVVWMFDEKFEKVAYNYFNSGPIIETETGTYADKSAPISSESVTWNHSLSEVVNSLISNKLTINSLDEFDYSPYNCFQETIDVAPKKYRIAHLKDKIPMVFAIVATKAEQA